MRFVDIIFAGGERIQVPPGFSGGMCDVFRDSETIHASALHFENHGSLVKKIASAFSDEESTSKVRVTARISALDTLELMRVMEFSNYFCHDMVLDITSYTLAKRLAHLSTSEIETIFGMEDISQRKCIPMHHIIRHVRPFRN
jgi:hypothetical protein